jgi:hypothetical protein
MSDVTVGTMTWSQRAESYRGQFRFAYLAPDEVACEGDWAFGMWFMGQSYQKKNGYYGGYQGNFLQRMAALFPDRKRVLHLFAGQVDQGPFPGDTLDIRPDLNPTYCCDAETCDGVPLYVYDFVLADSPYSASDAEHYGTCMVNRNKVVKTLANGLPSGALIAWLDQVYPMYSKTQLRTEAVIGIIGSTNHRFRVLSVFRKL